MRKYIISLLSLFVATLTYGHATYMNAANDTLPSVPKNTNYVLTRSMLTDDGGQYLDKIQFYDGIGRESEWTFSNGIDPWMGPLYKHLLQEYDSLGRVEKKWLPAVSGKTFQEPDFYKKLILWDYSNDERPFSQTIYESSPLNRAIRQYGSGEAWADHPARMEYPVNASADSLRCSFYYINAYNYIARRDDYLPGELNVTKVTDEDGKTSYTFVDKQEHTVLVRQQNGSEMVDTYSVYDNMGRLRFVLPPMINDDISLSSLDMYTYEYRYDAFGRCIWKKNPGCAPVRYVYDKADRVILSQNGNQSLTNEWTFTFCDNLGRESLKGICYFTVPPSLDNVIVRAYRISIENGGVLGTGYEVENFPHTLSSLLLANYYDDYYFTSNTKLTFHFDIPAAQKYDPQYINATYGSVSARGLLTGTKVKVLDSDLYLSSVFYYDHKGRLVQSRSQNHKGGYEVEYYSYTFSGMPSAKLYTRQVENGKLYVEEYDYKYNNVNDIVSINHKWDNAVGAVKLAYYSYDEARRIQFKDLGQKGVITRYQYDIRDQVTDATSPFFSQQLFYHDGTGTPSYNGNISSMMWSSPVDTDTRGYCFNYDGLNRMVNAEYGEGSDISLNRGRFDEHVISYDKNGNILGMKRSGQTGIDSYGIVDSLLLSYNGNRLLCVTDGAAENSYGNGLDFKDGSQQSIEYSYDLNGNLTQDLNKSISLIQYNYLNLPSKISFTDGSIVDYLYGADGKKLRVTHTNGDSVSITDYCANAIYENDTLSRVMLEEEGYLSFSGSAPIYNYFLKDIQGNVRVVYNQDREVTEVNHYYPFGGLLSGTLDVQPNKYNGKELDRKNGLNWYDYGARMYDAALGRWHMVDPMAEKYYGISPYNYCANNPVKYVDPDGRTIVIWYNNNRSSYTYSGGNVTHSNPFVQSVITAYQYNKANGIKAGNGGGASTVAIVENSNIRVNVTEAIYEDKYSPDATPGTIYWKSDWGSQKDNGTVNSPATILDHEASHALEHKTNPETYEVNRNSKDLQYDTKEERRVITGSEQKTSRANGETRPGQVTRRNHHGRTVITTGVTSNTIDTQKTQIYEKKGKKTWTSEP